VANERTVLLVRGVRTSKSFFGLIYTYFPYFKISPYFRLFSLFILIYAFFFPRIPWHLLDAPVSVMLELE